MKYNSEEYKKAQIKYNKLSEKEKQEIEKEVSKIREWFNKNSMYIIPILYKKEKSLTDMGVLGKLSDNFCEKFKVAPIIFIQYLQSYKESLEYHIQKDNNKNKDNNKKKEQGPICKGTIGDMMKAKGIIIK